MESDDYRPRPTDHLVEPFYEGLGHRPPDGAADVEGGEDARGERAVPRGWLTRWLDRWRSEWGASGRA